MSSPPKAPTASRTMRRLSASFVKSHGMPWARPPALVISSTVSLMRPRSMSATATAAPSRANRTAPARPMPDADAVISAILPLRRMLAPPCSRCAFRSTPSAGGWRLIGKRAPVGAGARGRAQRVAGQLGAVGGPASAGIAHLVDELLEHADARRAPAVLRMQDEHREPAHLVDAKELVAPDRADRRGREDLAVERGAEPEGIEGPIVEDPRGGQLDDGGITWVAVWPERILKVAGVEEPVLAQEPDRLVRDLVERRAIADGRCAGDVGENARAAGEDCLLLGPCLALESFVQVAVVADLVATAVDFGHHVGPALGGPAGNEERRSEAIALEEIEDHGDADLGAVCPLGHDADPVDVGGIARDPGRLGVEVEGQAHGGSHPGGPGYWRSHGGPPNLYREEAAVDDQLGPGDVRGLVGGEKQYGVSDLLDPSGALHRDRLQRRLPPVGIRRRPGRPHGGHEARVDGVDANTVRRELHSGRLGHDAHRSLGGVVAHVNALLAGEAGDRRDVDDGPASRGAHRGHRALHAQKDPLGI